MVTIMWRAYQTSQTKRAKTTFDEHIGCEHDQSIEGSQKQQLQELLRPEKWDNSAIARLIASIRVAGDRDWLSHEVYLGLHTLLWSPHRTTKALDFMSLVAKQGIFWQKHDYANQSHSLLHLIDDSFPFDLFVTLVAALPQALTKLDMYNSTPDARYMFTRTMRKREAELVEVLPQLPPMRMGNSYFAKLYRESYVQLMRDGAYAVMQDDNHERMHLALSATEGPNVPLIPDEPAASAPTCSAVVSSLVCGGDVFTEMAFPVAQLLRGLRPAMALLECSNVFAQRAHHRLLGDVSYGELLVYSILPTVSDYLDAALAVVSKANPPLLLAMFFAACDANNARAIQRILALRPDFAEKRDSKRHLRTPLMVALASNFLSRSPNQAMVSLLWDDRGARAVDGHGTTLGDICRDLSDAELDRLFGEHRVPVLQARPGAKSTQPVVPSLAVLSLRKMKGRLCLCTNPDTSGRNLAVTSLLL